MTKNLLTSFYALFFTLLAANIFSQTQMAIWTFSAVSNASTNPLSPTSYSVASAPILQQFFQLIDNNGINGTAYTDISGTNHTAGNAISWDDIKGTGADAELVIDLNSGGWNNMYMRFNYKSETTNSFDIDYSIDGGSNWTQVINNSSLTDDGFVNWSSTLKSDILDAKKQGSAWQMIPKPMQPNFVEIKDEMKSKLTEVAA